MSDDLRGQSAVITGATRGIGRAIALNLAESGVDIIANYHQNEKTAQELLKEVETLEGRCVLVRGDVSRPDDARRVIQSAVENFDRLDILVNNAGITRDNLLVRMKEEDFNRVMEINLLGTFYCTKYAGKIMMKVRYGRIINISSVVGMAGNAGQVNYAASKAGIIGLTRSAAKELGIRNITVNAVAPGYIKTDMTEQLSEGQKQKILSRVSLARFGWPEEVAHAVRFLASDKANYITGQVLRIDGGMEI